MDMTNDIIYIDGQNILTTWGLTPLSGKFYSEIMKYPDAKDRVTEDFTDEDGIRVLLTPTKLKAAEVTLSFDVDTYENYLAFCDYMDSHPTFVLSSFRVDHLRGKGHDGGIAYRVQLVPRMLYVRS